MTKTIEEIILIVRKKEENIKWAIFIIPPIIESRIDIVNAFLKMFKFIVFIFLNFLEIKIKYLSREIIFYNLYFKNIPEFNIPPGEKLL